MPSPGKLRRNLPCQLGDVLHLQLQGCGFGSAASTSVIVTSWNPEAMRLLGRDDIKSMVARDRQVFAQVSPWYSSIEERSEAGEYCQGVLKALRSKDDREGRTQLGAVSNIRLGQDMGTVFSQEQVAEIRDVKALWDEKDLGWNPAVNGW